MGALEGKVAIVTGAGRGIGRATAELMAREGARVVVNELDEGPGKEAVQAILDAGGEATLVLGSVADPDACRGIVDAALEAYGDLHVLVNNAGVTRDRTIHRMTDAEWDLVLDVVLKGPFNMLRAAATAFRQEPGDDEAPVHRKVVNIASNVGLDGNAGQANYASAKAGVVGLTKTLSREWARYRVNVNAVAPGFIDTRLTRPPDEDTGLGIPEHRREMITSFLPWGVGRPADVAHAVLYLASPASDYVTGEVLRVEGPPMGSGF